MHAMKSGCSETCGCCLADIDAGLGDCTGLEQAEPLAGATPLHVGQGALLPLQLWSSRSCCFRSAHGQMFDLSQAAAVLLQISCNLICLLSALTHVIAALQTLLLAQEPVPALKGLIRWQVHVRLMLVQLLCCLCSSGLPYADLLCTCLASAAELLW